MEIINFEPFEDLTNIPDSMLIDSDTEIARLTLDDFVVKYATLEVRGDVIVTFKGERYRTPSEFPEELKELIRNDPNFWDPECSGVYVVNNNWFKAFLWDENNQYLTSDYVDAENLSADSIKEMLLGYAEEYKDQYNIDLAKDAISEGNQIVTYYRLGDVTNWGAPEVKIIVPYGGCVSDKLEELLHNAKDSNMSDEEILKNYLMEPMPDDWKDIYEDEYEGYMSIDLGYGIKGFSVASIEGTVITQVDDQLVYISDPDNAGFNDTCYVRDFSKDGSLEKYKPVAIFRRSTDPEHFDSEMEKYGEISGIVAPYDIDVEVVTDNDIIFFALKKEEE